MLAMRSDPIVVQWSINVQGELVRRVRPSSGGKRKDARGEAEC
jgi:hypothetical protein